MALGSAMLGKRLDIALSLSALGLLLAQACSSTRPYAGSRAEGAGEAGEAGAPNDLPSSGDGGAGAEEPQACESNEDCETPPGSARCFDPLCSVAGECLYLRHEPGTECGTPASCSGVTRLSPEVCDEAGACEAVVEDCSPFLCDEVQLSCFTSCSDTDQCLPNHRCDDGACVALARLGGACSADEECRRGHCGCGEATCSAAEKVCLPAACEEPCRYDPGANGECESFIAPGSDDLANSCGDTECNGSGGCQMAVGTACTSNDQCDGGHCECVDSTCTSRLCTAGGCAPCQYWNIAACGDIAAGFQDPDGCVGDLSCKYGSCVNRKPHGASCTFDDECSDTCIDEICAPESDTGGPCDFGQQNDCIHGDVCHTDGYFCSLMSSGCCDSP